MARTVTPTLLTIVFALAAATGCSTPDGTAKEGAQDDKLGKDGSSAAAQAGENDGPRSETSSAALRSLVAWLDPAAVAAAFIRDDKGLDPLLVGAVFGMPPQATELLEAGHDVEFGLETILGDGESVADWFGQGVLVMAPPMATDVYVLRPLKRPKAEFEAMLEKAGLMSHEAEGFRIFVPKGAFPWKVVALDDHAVAFIPARELGSGLGPLTAGRDMPPSELENQITQFMESDPTVFVTLHAGGPLMHLDLPDRIALTQLALREWNTGGIDAQIVLQPMGDVDETATALEKRDHPEETHQVQSLMDDVAFVPEGDVVVGRLQIPPERVRHLQ